jgi:diaminopropionate ammonia-lyase
MVAVIAEVQEDKNLTVVANPLYVPQARGERATPPAAPFHQSIPGYAPTPLVSIPALAERLGVGELLVKCESERFGLPAFKMLGASWAIYRAICRYLGEEPDPSRGFEHLAAMVAPMRPFTLAAATDGNHGRAVARMARMLGFSARIFVPEGTTPGRMEAIAGEGAEVIVVEGDYDAAVARSAEEAGERCLVISDTSWPGYEDVPAWVIEGYETLYAEIDDDLAATGRDWPAVVFVPVGVGALAAATVNHFSDPDRNAPAIIGVEPSDADCVSESLAAGEITTVPGPHRSIMAGLNCGTPSLIAWPTVSRGLAGVVSIGDGWARDAVRDLAVAGVQAGETGAAGLAGLAALRSAGPSSPLVGTVPDDSSVMVICTEGASDPAQWWAILGVELVGPAKRSISVSQARGR